MLKGKTELGGAWQEKKDGKKDNEKEGKKGG